MIFFFFFFEEKRRMISLKSSHILWENVLYIIYLIYAKVVATFSPGRLIIGINYAE